MTFRPEPRIDGIVALRRLLKVALRAFGLRAIAIKVAVADGGDA
ncbi:MAG: hypothetical protein ACREJ5_04340 [Geminicoccaceae bacterium]